ncbi:homoserine dehydrogenase [Candidatus Haliotispira prima]|uniref:Homoserine dehydrogenase n=1 Tax=Candidatus Haliotispira prima TaxID=3034016 RepID=A0ABY8MJP7_9SPIO|nr:homoserine dehydrogenase [Candidatus Haliotispira prima]
MAPNKRPFRILLLGIGTVGGAVLRILQKQTQSAGIVTELAAVMSRHAGQRLKEQTPEYAQQLDPGQIFNSWEELREALEDGTEEPGPIGSIDTVVELIGGTDSCLPIYRYFLQRKIPIVTANKALLAEYGTELYPLAQQNQTFIACEASCGGGIPILQTLLYGLRANRIHEFHGVLNGTCNFILSRMAAEGHSYADVLHQAQAAGLAEANPFLDVSGTDTAHKLSILATMSFGYSLKLQDIPTSGIDTLTKTQIQAGKRLGLATKLLASARLSDRATEQTNIALRVGPCFVPQQGRNCPELQESLTASPLASLTDSFNGISFYGDTVGHIYLEGRGAGGSATASAVLSDLIQIQNGSYPSVFADFPNWPRPEKLPVENSWSEFRQNWLVFVPLTKLATVEKLADQQQLRCQNLFREEGHQVFFFTQASATQMEQLARSLSTGKDTNADAAPVYIPILQVPEERLQGDID